MNPYSTMMSPDVNFDINQFMSFSSPANNPGLSSPSINPALLAHGTPTQKALIGIASPSPQSARKMKAMSGLHTVLTTLAEDSEAHFGSPLRDQSYTLYSGPAGHSVVVSDGTSEEMWHGSNFFGGDDVFSVPPVGITLAPASSTPTLSYSEAGSTSNAPTPTAGAADVTTSVSVRQAGMSPLSKRTVSGRGAPGALRTQKRIRQATTEANNIIGRRARTDPQSSLTTFAPLPARSISAGAWLQAPGMPRQVSSSSVGTMDGMPLTPQLMPYPAPDPFASGNHPPWGGLSVNTNMAQMASDLQPLSSAASMASMAAMQASQPSPMLSSSGIPMGSDGIHSASTIDGQLGPMSLGMASSMMTSPEHMQGTFTQPMMSTSSMPGLDPSSLPGSSVMHFSQGLPPSAYPSSSTMSSVHSFPGSSSTGFAPNFDPRRHDTGSTYLSTPQLGYGSTPSSTLEQQQAYMQSVQLSQDAQFQHLNYPSVPPHLLAQHSWHHVQAQQQHMRTTSMPPMPAAAPAMQRHLSDTWSTHTAPSLQPRHAMPRALSTSYLPSSGGLFAHGTVFAPSSGTSTVSPQLAPSTPAAQFKRAPTLSPNTNYLSYRLPPGPRPKKGTTPRKTPKKSAPTPEPPAATFIDPAVLSGNAPANAIATTSDGKTAAVGLDEDTLRGMYTEVREMDTKTGQSVKRFRCGMLGCGRSFPRKSAINSHLQTHVDDKPYMCTDPEWYVIQVLV